MSLFITVMTGQFGMDQGRYHALAVVPNYLMILGAAVLWFAFVVLGIIARRYEIVLGERTGWQFMVLAPTGILAFAVIQLVYCGIGGNIMLPKAGVNYVAYGFFLVSGSLSLFSSLRFRAVTKGR